MLGRARKGKLSLDGKYEQDPWFVWKMPVSRQAKHGTCVGVVLSGCSSTPTASLADWNALRPLPFTPPPFGPEPVGRRAGRLHGAPRLNRTICRCQTCQAQFSHSPITVSCKLSFELSGMLPIPWNKSRAAEGCPVPSLVMPSHADQIQCFGALFRLLSKALVTYRVLH